MLFALEAEECRGPLRLRWKGILKRPYILEQPANLPIMSVCSVLWLAVLIRPKKKQAGEDQGTSQVYAWPATERIFLFCPQEWQKEFFELDLVGWGVLLLRRGGHGGDLHEEMKAVGGLDRRAAW